MMQNDCIVATPGSVRALFRQRPAIMPNRLPFIVRASARF